jgi:biotin carboxylase
MRNVFILGAGFMQKPAILTAKELGCRVIAADGNKDAYCVSLCDEFAHIDLKNIDALCEFALNLKKNSRIDAVFTAGTDFSAACAKIAETCGLHSHSYKSALNASDKILMRSCFAKAGVSSPKFIEIEDSSSAYKKENILQLLQNNGFPHNPFPLVVKPVDNMGARGCRMVRAGNELTDAVKTAVSYSRSKRAIIEEYMDGPEFSIDSLVYNDTITITGFADRHIYYPPYFIEMGHTMPSAISEDLKTRIFEEFKKGVKALGLTCGAAKGDVKLTKNGPKIGEIAARLSGGYMSGWTYPYASGINLTEQALRIALGDAPSIPLTGMPKEPLSTSAERAWVSIPGIVKSVSGYDDAEKIPHVKDIFPRIKEGDIVNFPVNNVEKCGNIISCAENREEAVQSAESAVKKIIIRLDPKGESTKTFLEEDPFTEFPPSAYQVSKNNLELLLSSSKGKTIRLQDLIMKADEMLSDFLQSDKLCDWNHKSASYALKQFCVIAETEKNNSKIIHLEQFWRYFIRGGLQGLLYLLDGEA